MRDQIDRVQAAVMGLSPVELIEGVLQPCQKLQFAFLPCARIK
jgi:hypothetical protein